MDIGRIVRHPAAPAAACTILVVLIYQILGDWSVAGDALRACAAGIAAAACLMWSRRQDAGRPSARGRGQAAPPCALCLVASAASVAVPLLLTGAADFAWPSAALVAILAVSCLGTAVWEESLFRGLLFDAIADELGGLKAALACSLVFAVLHCGTAGGTADAVLRFIQVFSFGFAMAGVVATARRGLVWAIATHALYDLLCFAPALIDAAGLARSADPWFVPAQLLSVLETTVPGMAASLAFLVPAALWTYLALKNMR